MQGNVKLNYQPIEIVIAPNSTITVSENPDIVEIMLELNEIKSGLSGNEFKYTDPGKQHGGGYPGYILHMNGDSHKDMYFIKLVDGDLPNFAYNDIDYDISKELIDELVEVIEKHVNKAEMKPQSEVAKEITDKIQN